jgi:hypothetical protein
VKKNHLNISADSIKGNFMHNHEHLSFFLTKQSNFAKNGKA